ncbi:MAG: cysteine-rich small domain-containing protein [Clostridiales bacterium]|nr:cysteine-rich small domain-containing protein [Clostridiales bacterium]
MEEINCLFCCCPFCTRDKCLGNPHFIDISRGRIKDCSDCCFPHRAENYEEIMAKLKEQD